MTIDWNMKVISLQHDLKANGVNVQCHYSEHSCRGSSKLIWATRWLTILPYIIGFNKWTFIMHLIPWFEILRLYRSCFRTIRSLNVYWKVDNRLKSSICHCEGRNFSSFFRIRIQWVNTRTMFNSVAFLIIQPLNCS